MIAALLLACALSGAARADIPPPERREAPAVTTGSAPANSPGVVAPDGVAPAPATEVPSPAAAPAPAIDPSDLIGPPAGPPLTGDALREQTHVVAKLMRCPVCQGLSVADSRTESALAMKAEIEALVAQGYDTEQVLFYFEASYGEFIRLAPKFEGVNVLVWAAPVLLLLGGVGWVFWFANSAGRRARAPSKPASPEAPAAAAGVEGGLEGGVGAAPADPSDPALAAYLRRVREESS